MTKDWTGNSNSIYKTLGASNHTDKERQNEDYYATCFYNKKVVKGTKEAFTVKYQPSKSAKEGVFMFFGIERND